MYKVKLSRQARKYYESADAGTARRLNEVFVLLKGNAFPPGAERLKGELAGSSKIRVGQLRIIYDVIESVLRIDVIKIGPRGDVYK